MKTKRAFTAGLILVLAVLLGTLPPQPASAEVPRPVRQQVMKGVVQIFAVNETRSGFEPQWWGSGTIITQDGLILTNCHVAFPEAMGGPSYDVLVVYLTIRSDQPPQPTYIAELAQYDPDLDLAVIRVTKTLDGDPIDPADLNLPTVTLGNSDDLEIGDNLSIFGYPVVGGETISFVTGVVSGFSSERAVQGRAWIKTNASIAGGNSGGTAVNDAGELVGVPTQMGSGSEDTPIADCRYIQDTNGDGVVDENDTCVFTGFFNALRPVNLATPLIEAAAAGLGPQPLPEPKEPVQPSGKAAVSRLFFAPAVNEANQPTTVVNSFASGTNEIYLFFDYANFQDGVTWQPVLLYKSQTYTSVWPLAPWSGGPQGIWWVSLYDNPLADGEYQFDLYYDMQKLSTAKVTVGGKGQTGPAFTDISFSGGGQEGFVLPAGTKQVDATFSYTGMTAQTKWSYTWYYQGKKLTGVGGDGPALTKASGVTTVSLPDSKGLAAGAYRLELLIGGKLAATSDFLLAGSQNNATFFGPITFAEGVDKKDKPVKPGTGFDSGISEIYAFFDYTGMQDGMTWGRRWSLDGTVVVDVEDSWEGGQSGNWWVAINNGEDALPDGQYQLELTVEGQAVQAGTCSIGAGPGPTPSPTPVTNGVEIYGQITDADTGKGIPGAVFLVLQPGITADSFQWTEEEVYAIAEADRKGNYQLSEPLARGETYSMIVGADGYDAVSEDGITIREDLESPFELNVTLQKTQ